MTPNPTQWLLEDAAVTVPSASTVKGVLRLRSPRIAASAQPGQFVNVAVPGHVLRRPMAVAWAQDDELELVITARGEATQRLLSAQSGSSWSLIGPLGRSFPLPEGPGVIVTGGSGAGPGLFLAWRLAQAGRPVVLLHGARVGDEAFVADRAAGLGVRAVMHTEDGSLGLRGYPTASLRSEALALAEQYASPPTVYAVGPNALMAAAARVAAQENWDAWVSLEEAMACGVGACLSCACQVRDATGQPSQAHVCVDGPVFSAARVSWPLGA